MVRYQGSADCKCKSQPRVIIDCRNSSRITYISKGAMETWADNSASFIGSDGTRLNLPAKAAMARLIREDAKSRV